ncbi:ABC transporter permease [Bacillus sp. FJAT-45350]|uniref:ABC transporter permease n=1 Tax=Bacillus sp. FJAT-45350 TaxID=2011014 RepID=UPI000BB908D1|nr:ABC transporter permease [Bacillus sp. FJAT-45350]
MGLLRLIQNENMKIYKRTGTWVMIGMLVLAILVVAIFTNVFMTTSENWKEQLVIENQHLMESVSGMPMLEVANRHVEQRMAINNYRIENDIPPIESTTLWGFMIDSTTFTGFVSLFTIVIAAGIVASEFSWGTIKLLLIRPVSRGKILLSKFLATLLFALILLLLLFFSSFVLGAIFFGLGGAELPYLAYMNGDVVEKNMLSHIFSLFAFRSIDLIMMTTVAFMISTVFRSSSLAIGISIFLMFTGPQMVQLFSQYDWVKYILFANTDLLQYVNGTPLVEGMTMTFSIVMLLIYFLALVILSWVIFEKRDVAV